MRAIVLQLRMTMIRIALLVLTAMKGCCARHWMQVVEENHTVDRSSTNFLRLENRRLNDINGGDATSPAIQGLSDGMYDVRSNILPTDPPVSRPMEVVSGTSTIRTTRVLTQRSSAPATTPTKSPTVDPFQFPNPQPPSNPDPWYFNYDTTSRYGPGELELIRVKNNDRSNDEQLSSVLVGIHNDHWGQVTYPVANSYWTEFTDVGIGPYRGVLQIHHPEQNMCTAGRSQSPIDLRESSGTEAICREEHEVRSLPGDFPLTDGNVEKRIEGNKLRLVYKRRPCADPGKSECQEPDPPHADFPNGWGGFADVVHVDFKVPSEHTIEGERFDGEMQIFHIHPGRRRLAAQSVLIRAHPDGYNYYFQEALDAFQVEYDKNAILCNQRLAHSNRNRLLSTTGSGPFADFLAWARGNVGWNTANRTEMTKTEDDVWDPYHVMLIPSIYFYRYEGSLTEPPCGEFVSWWVSDQPMTIGVEQLQQLQTILFTNVDGITCDRTSVHYEQSVARPIQQLNSRPVYRCTFRNFGPDP